MAITAYANAASRYGTSGVVADIGISGARVRCSKGSISLAAADIDTVGDTIALAPIPTGARIHNIFIMSDNLGTAVTADCGLYNTDANRTVIDADAYASALSIDAIAAPSGAAGSCMADFRWESASTNLNTMEQRVWQDGGQTSDPRQIWLVALTITAVTSAVAGDLSFLINYTVD